MRAKRISVFLVMIITAFSLCLGDIAIPKVHAEDGLRDADKIALIVYYVDDSVGDGDSNKIKELRSFTMAELYDIALKEGGGTYKKYTYSSFNTNENPSPKLVYNATGPTVKTLLNESLKSADIDEVDNISGIANDCVIEFISKDGYTGKLTKEQLFDEVRYYYPKFENEAGKNGEPVDKANMEGKTEVPAIISLTEEEDGVVCDKYTTNKSVGRLLIGQLVPNEQNKPAFVQHMTGGDLMLDSVASQKRGAGKIYIHSHATSKWNSIKEVNDGRNILWVGEKITFDRSVNPEIENGQRCWIYYTTDGSEPTNMSKLYNYNNNSYGSKYEKLNRVEITRNGQTENLKIKVCGYGKPDSDVTGIAVTGKEIEVPNTSIKSVASKGYNTLGITWYKKEGVSGYQLYRSNSSSSGYSLIKTINGDSTTYYADSSRTTGKRYYYKIKPFVTITDTHTGEIIRTKNGDTSSYKSGVAIPSNTSITYIKGGTRKISLKWKKVSGATGYKIYRSTKKSSGYKAIKTITKGSTVSYTNKSLKKGRTYYYKIKAYRKVGSKYYYSNYSTVKSAKAK